MTRSVGKNVCLKNSLLWMLAVLLTLTSAIYQRMTGPTHPFRGSYQVENRTWRYRLTRNPTTDAPFRIKLPGPESSRAEIVWREYPTQRAWKKSEMTLSNQEYLGVIPVQPSAGKVEFFIRLFDESGASLVEVPGNGDRIIARYKDPVPSWALIPHIILMFTAMLTSNRLLFSVIFREKIKPYLVWITFLTLTTGGLIFGPIVQHYAFGAAWTGWPVGNDLTDNKSAIAFLAWLISIIGIMRQKDCRRWVMVASIITLAVYLIPHSVLGSQHDYPIE